MGLKPGLVEIPIYGSEYEIKQKKPYIAGSKPEYETITLAPSIAEKILYEHIEDNPTEYLLDSKVFKGSLTLQPDLEYQDDTHDLIQTRVIKGLSVEAIEKSGSYPEWEAPKSYSKNGYSNYSKGISIDDKATWLKSELKETILDSTFKADESIAISTCVRKIVSENESNEQFLVLYFNLINSILK